MPQKSSFIVIGVVVILIAGMVVWGIKDSRTQTTSSVNDTTLNSMMIYYYGAECPHCQRVQEFLDDNKIADKVQYTKKEVWHDAQNNAEFLSRAQSVCGLDQSKLGVPFVIVDGKCYTGEDEVMSIFKQKAGIQ